jgi:hypothetical protein
MTDQMLHSILKKELPQALNRMNINVTLGDAAMNDLVNYLVDYAKSCNKTDEIRELKDLRLNSFTPAQCLDLKNFLDQVVRIRTVSKDFNTNKSLVRNIVGKIWTIIVPDKYFNSDGPGVDRPIGSRS